MDKLIRELREENEKLKKMFEGGGLPDLGAGAAVMSMWCDLLKKWQYCNILFYLLHIFHAWRLVENDPKQKSPW